MDSPQTPPNLDVQLAEFLRLDRYTQQLSDYGLGVVKRFIVDFTELATYAQDYARQLQASPDQQLEYLQNAFAERLRFANPQHKYENKTIQIGFRNFPETVPLRQLHEHVGRLVAIRGIITRGTLPSPLIIRGAFKCRKCNTVTFVELDTNTTTIPQPEICGRCRSRILDLQGLESERVANQYVTIQEIPDEMPSDKPPAIYNVRLLADLVDRLPIGAHVEMSVVPRLTIKHKRSGGLSALTSVWLDCLWLEDLQFEESQELTPKDIEEIQAASKDTWLERRMVTSICPSLYGLEHVKQAVLYQMLGGVDQYARDGSYQRGFSSVLIIGDPSAGKTTLLMYVARLVPRAHYSSGVSSSGKGLTALIGKDENGVMELRIGAVVMANGSICCLDECEKARSDDRVALHECMETGKITVDKGGFNTQLNAHTAILAAGNPVLGRYDPYKNITENINLPVTLLSRFDLIFIIRDVPDPESDGKVVDRLLAAHRGMPLVEEGHDFYEHDFLRKYIMYARRLKPKLTDEAAKQIREFYLEIRKKSGNEDSPFTLATRQGQALIRLAAARAKLHLREEITKEDVVTVWALMNRSLQESGMDTETGKVDIDTIMTGTPTSARSKMELILSTISKLEKERGEADELDVYKLLQPQLTEYEVRDALQKLTRDGVLFNPKPGYIKRAKF